MLLHGFKILLINIHVGHAIPDKVKNKSAWMPPVDFLKNILRLLNAFLKLSVLIF